MANDNNMFFEKSKMTNSPCQFCTKRNAYCHGTCKDYIEFNEKRAYKPVINNRGGGR